MFEQGHFNLLPRLLFIITIIVVVITLEWKAKRGDLYYVSLTGKTCPGTVGFQKKSRSSYDLCPLLLFESAEPRWEGMEGHSRSVTEEPIPSERPERHGCGHAICFQSRSQRNPPLLEEVEFCLLPQSLVCLIEDSQVHSKHMAGHTSYSDDITHP